MDGLKHRSSNNAMHTDGDSATPHPAGDGHVQKDSDNSCCATTEYPHMNLA